MFFYVKDNQCFVGDNGLPKNTIGYKFYESDTKIEIYDNRNRANYFNGLITDLKKENDSVYADKADLEAALPDFFNAAKSGYKSYLARVNQSGTSIPNAIVRKNELSNITYTREGGGFFRAYCQNGEFKADKVSVLTSNISHFGSNVFFVESDRRTDNDIYFNIINTAGNKIDGFVIFLEIRVYD